MSEEYQSLDPAARARYLAKLQVLGLKEDDDPFATWNDSRFEDNMSLWPPMEYPHIFCYFVEHPGVYMQQELMQWTSLKAYNYFENGHVRTVEIWPVDSTSCILRAVVNPSQQYLLIFPTEPG